jgi:hypothetical protein
MQELHELAKKQRKKFFIPLLILTLGGILAGVGFLNWPVLLFFLVLLILCVSSFSSSLNDNFNLAKKLALIDFVITAVFAFIFLQIVLAHTKRSIEPYLVVSSYVTIFRAIAAAVYTRLMYEP